MVECVKNGIIVVLLTVVFRHSISCTIIVRSKLDG